MGLRALLNLVTLISSIAVFHASSSWADPTLFLADPQDAANVRLNLAHEAKNELMVVSYAFDPDRAGLTVLAELRDAARRGKRSVLVVDQFASKLTPAMLTYLNSEGVEVYTYRPFDWKKPFQYFKRMHLKLFVVDGKHLVTGDSNIAAHYFGLGDHTNLSRSLYIQGKSAQDARGYIQKLIASPDVKRFTATRITPATLVEQKRQIDLVEGKKLTGLFRTNDEWKKRVSNSDAVEFIFDPIDKKGKVPGMEKNIIEAIDRARSRIVFENAYVVLTDQFKAALERAAKRGVKIVGITNSFESTNAKAVGYAWPESREFLKSIGAEVWEHRRQPEKHNPENELSQAEKFRRVRSHLKKTQTAVVQSDLVHAKTLLIDDSESFIMSYNFDPRSEIHNLESGVHIKDKKFAAELESEINKELASSKYVLVASDGQTRAPDHAPKPSCVQGVLLRIFKSQL